MCVDPTHDDELLLQVTQLSPGPAAAGPVVREVSLISTVGDPRQAVPRVHGSKSASPKCDAASGRSKSIELH